MKIIKNNKKIILKPIFNKETNVFDFVNKVKDKIDLLYINPETHKEEFHIKTIFPSKHADYVILNNINEFEVNVNKPDFKKTLENEIKEKNVGKKYGVYKKIQNNKDIDEIKSIAEKGVDFVIIDLDDWKIIPLENVIAALQQTNTEIFSIARSIEEVETLFTVLELGINGVIFETKIEEEIVKIKEIIQDTVFDITTAKIIEIKDVGIGERVCIDTVSILSEGEGMLVGNRSNFLFIVHNESIGSSFTSPRPFRVNAGAVHCYTITPDKTTKYLSELESGSKVLIVNSKGHAREVSVGRSKIETRPLRLFKAQNQNEIGTIIVQNAETIQFIGKNKTILPVTHIKIGDEILVFFKKPSGRHFGMEVSSEYILEK